MTVYLGSVLVACETSGNIAKAMAKLWTYAYGYGYVST